MEVMDRRGEDDAASKMGKIMRRYRPIAPKPLAASLAVEITQPVGIVKTRETARRKNNSFGRKRGRKATKVEPVAKPDPSGSSCTAPVVTLPLMPVTPERKETRWINGSESALFRPVLPVAELVVSSHRPLRAATVSVTVESVTKAWSSEFYAIAGRDDELRRWLEVSDCPAFVSRDADRVTWTNAAYRKMVCGGVSAEHSPSSSSSSSSSYSSTSWSDSASLPEAAAEEEVRVLLATRDLIPDDTCRAFTCMTSVWYACVRQGKVSLAVPCDVWRLEDGSLAWRLDVKAALSLSTGN